ncbi:NAD-dependent epimerase/dehydratase family protein [Enterococcus sp. 1001283B150225_161107_E12]|uniref:NAD-dependent epimerase/dehydratase family protein n=1 Tax=Enterococcus sp. 1001283B150225_161107_E12 TaxID=2787145 RepID=UPI00189D86B3|nr:NAD-dependent epimerase/dehydratase family protein [Enterococcus sp. 1001283B150225_161107_E12]
MENSDVFFPENSKFLVTGGAGFVGSNLCEAILNLGYKVRCLDNLSTGFYENIKPLLDKNNFEFIEGSITDFNICENACKDVDYVLHQAAWGSVPRSIKMPLYYEEVNIKGTLNMMEAAVKNNVKKFVYASSSSVYGDSSTMPKTEGSEGNLLSPYALTKRTNEYYGKLYSDLYGLDTYGLRYFNVFGRRQNPEGDYAAVIPKFIKGLIEDEAPIINGDGTQSRDFTYIDNVIEANLKACAASTVYSGESFNIAFGQQKSLLLVYETLCNLLNKNISPNFGPERKGDIKHSHADISKARMMLNYSPKWSFEQGIEASLKWYMEYYNEKN